MSEWKKKQRQRRQTDEQTERQADSEEISVAAMTGESEVSQSGVGLAKCHSDHLESERHTHTHTESGWAGGERKGGVQGSAVELPSTSAHLERSFQGGAPACGANINILMLALMGTSRIINF